MQPVSKVEKIALKKSGYRLKYAPNEKIGVIVVDNFPHLGKLTALRFLDWVQNHPGGVISLPTGKTPEFFIKEVRRFLDNWDNKEIQREIELRGVDCSRRPDLRSLHFVQMDDFYPIDPKQHNSFYYYVNKFYIKGLGLDPDKALLINCSRVGIPKGKKLADIWPGDKVDLSLRYRHPCNPLEKLQKQVIEKVDQWCSEYENIIRELGGIDFFLGGIGPDGHIGFNISGSDLYSTTRLMPTNYETQAAAANDLGGIEISKKRLVITIGLSTITCNRDCLAIIIAAGESKARIVADAIQHPEHVHYPATVLHKLPNARFFITRGAANLLGERRLVSLSKAKKISNREIEKIIINLSLETGKRIDALTKEDFQKNRFATVALQKRRETAPELTKFVKAALIRKIENGIKIEQNKTFLHTEPHHDDIMLGYLPYVVRHIRVHSNQHYFVTLTSGFTAVTNQFMLNSLNKLKSWVKSSNFKELFDKQYFDPDNTLGRERDVWQYLDGVAAKSRVLKNEGRLRRQARNLIQIYGITDSKSLQERIKELVNYFKEQYPGKKDREDIQRLKGMCREWEADCIWGYFGWNSENVQHLRLGFYKGDIFSEEPTAERDVLPVLETLRKINPDVISVALDPEASGPDTHYKVLQAITEALKIYVKESRRRGIKVWGYRNVWYRFHPSEADLFTPVSLNMFALQDSSFKEAFFSQKDASFPSHEHDGPFSELAQKIQVEQYQALKTCLGREFFNENSNALVRATRGMVYLKCMNLKEFYQHSRRLKRSTENL